MWAAVSLPDGTAVEQGYTPLAFAGDPGQEYAATVEAEYGGITFDHWQDGSPDRARAVTLLPGENVTLAAYYRTPPTAALAVNSADLSGNALSGMHVTVAPADNSTIQEIFTNGTYAGHLGGAYNVTASDYVGIAFDHWEDGTTSSTRTVVLYGDREVTAYYRTAPGSVMALTPAAHVSKDRASLTLNAVSPDGSSLHMWSIIQPQEGDMYTVFVHDYGGYTFDHWEDGSKDRVRTLAVREDTTITAHYATGG